MKSKSMYAVLAAAMLALIVMPLAFAGAAPKQGAANASVKKQLRQLKQRIAALEGRQTPTTLPPSGPAGGDLIGTYPNPQLRPATVGTPEIAAAAVTNQKLAESAVTSDKIADSSVLAPDLGLDSVGAFALKGVTAVVGTGVSISAGTPKEATVTCPGATMLIGGGYAWLDKEANSIITNAPSEANPNQKWVVEGMVDAGSNTLFAWANCLAV